MADIQVIFNETPIEVTQASENVVVMLNEQGPPGPPGADGAQGPAWGTGPRNYTHSQSAPLATWSITHNLGFRPAGIVVIDSWGTNIVHFHISYTNENALELTFAGGTTGTAYLS